VAVREGAAARVLAGEPDVDAVPEERAEGEGLAGRPVERALAPRHRRARIEEAAEELMGPEVLGELREPAEDGDEPLARRRGVRGRRLVVGAALKAAPERA